MSCALICIYTAYIHNYEVKELLYVYLFFYAPFALRGTYIKHEKAH